MTHINSSEADKENKAIIEAALTVLERGQAERLTEQSIIDSLSSKSLQWLCELQHESDETPQTRFIDMLLDKEVLMLEEDKKRYSLGKYGNALINAYFADVVD